MIQHTCTTTLALFFLYYLQCSCFLVVDLGYTAAGIIIGPILGEARAVSDSGCVDTVASTNDGHF